MGSHGYMSSPNEAKGNENREPAGPAMIHHAPFTTLDRVLIDAVVGARQEIGGRMRRGTPVAPSPDHRPQKRGSTG